MKKEQIRLTESTYVILLALYKPLHGYGIMQAVKEMSNASIVIGPGTLYGVLKKLLKNEWITVNIEDGQKIYAISREGNQVVESEISRLKSLIQLAKCRKEFM